MGDPLLGDKSQRLATAAYVLDVFIVASGLVGVWKFCAAILISVEPVSDVRTRLDGEMKDGVPGCDARLQPLS
jgi:hypothetical protein